MPPVPSLAQSHVPAPRPVQPPVEPSASSSAQSPGKPAGKFAVCVVIPVYNHEHAIGSVVNALLAQGLPVILVDDGCSPVCARELERLSGLPEVTLLRHETNRGKGAAVITGFRAAASLGYTHVIQVDADGQHTLSDASRFVEAAREQPDAVICGRPVFDESIPKARYYGRLSHPRHGVGLQTLSFDIIDSMCGFVCIRSRPRSTWSITSTSVRAWISIRKSWCACIGGRCRCAGWTRASRIPSTACRTSECSWTTSA